MLKIDIGKEHINSMSPVYLVCMAWGRETIKESTFENRLASTSGVNLSVESVVR